MVSYPVLNPELPYVGSIDDGVRPGKMVKIQGTVPQDSVRFAINYQLGPTLNPRDDVALHVSPRFNEGFITRNHIRSMSWGPEENSGPMWIKQGSPFEIIILCEYECFKIAVNGNHFTEFAHRLPYDQITHLVIDGEVVISSIFYETINIGPRPTAPVPEFNSGTRPRAYRQEPEDDNVLGDCLDKVGLAVGGLVAAGGVAAALHAVNKNKHKHADEADHRRIESSQNESGGMGLLGNLGAALAGNLASNALQGNRASHAEQGYPPSSNVLGSILGALGGGPQTSYQQPAADPLGGALGSMLNSVLGGDKHHQGNQYQPSHGNSLLNDIGGTLFQSAVQGLSKHAHKSHKHNDESSPGYEESPEPRSIEGPYGGRPTSPRNNPPEDGQFTSGEISKGLGLDD